MITGASVEGQESAIKVRCNETIQRRNVPADYRQARGQRLNHGQSEPLVLGSRNKHRTVTYSLKEFFIPKGVDNFHVLLEIVLLEMMSGNQLPERGQKVIVPHIVSRTSKPRFRAAAAHAITQSMRLFRENLPQ